MWRLRDTGTTLTACTAAGLGDAAVPLGAAREPQHFVLRVRHDCPQPSQSSIDQSH